MNMHPTVTLERVCNVVEASAFNLDSPGICIVCGADVDGVEPDAVAYRCDACGDIGVYGAEELLIMLA